MRVLNLYAGLGGNRILWKDVEVTAVESDEKIADAYLLNNPNDKVVIGDAHQYLLENHQDFDFVWSSPPCQSHSKMIRSGRNRKPRYPDMRIYEEIILLEHDFEGKYVVENVVPYYGAMRKPKQLGRHLFWTNFSIPKMKNVPEFKDFINKQNLNDKERIVEWLGIKYEKNIYYDGNHCPTQVLRNCVHPLMGKHVFEAANEN